MRVLIVDDEQRIAQNIKKFLESNKYNVDISLNGEDALSNIEINSYDIIILDWMLPDISGVDICKKIRKNGIKTPVIILTAKSDIDDKLEGFDSGADDYVTKPFIMEELFARVKVLIRRKNPENASPIILVQDLEINTNSNEVTKKGKLVDLAPKEFALLQYLALNKGIALTRSDLLDHVWGDEVDPFSNTVDVHISYLRQKLGYDGDKLIKTVKGKGYMICDD